MPNNKYTVKARFEIGAAKTFTTTDVDILNNTAIITAHGYKTGDAIGFSTTGGVPTGLTVTTAYYVIQVDTNTIKFASSRANAFAGTAVDLTSVGTGVQSVRKNSTGTSLSGVIIPAHHYIVDTHYIVLTAGTATATTGTLACQVVAANDVVSAAAISTSVWDVTDAMVEGIPDLATEASYLLTTADVEIAFLTGTSPWLTGKIDFYFDVVPALL